MNKSRGFTIVELLVVIVVIGVLAAITIVSYVGIGQRAVVMSLQSDLANSSKRLKMYYTDNNIYPGQIDPINYCPTLPTDTRYCQKASSNNQFIYAPTDSTRTGFIIISTVNSTSYSATNNTAPSILQPVVASGGATTDAGNFRTHTYNISTVPKTFTVTNGGVVYVDMNGGGGGGGACYNQAGGDGAQSSIRIGSGQIYIASGGGGGTDAYGDDIHNNSPGSTTPFELFGLTGGALNGGAGVSGVLCGEGAADNGGAGGRVYGYLNVPSGQTVTVVIGGGGGGGYYPGESGENGDDGRVIFKYLIK